MPGTTFQATFFVESFDKHFSFRIQQTQSNFLTRLCLLPRIFSFSVMPCYVMNFKFSCYEFKFLKFRPYYI